MKISPQHEKILGNIARILAILGILLSISAIPFAQSTEKAYESYLEDLGIHLEKYKITNDDITLYGYLFFPRDALDAPNDSVPMIVHVNGMNTQKEYKLEHVINLVKLGFIVSTSDNRGHGQSGGRLSFYGEEPMDYTIIYDWARAQYPQINQTHYGASGFSYGAGQAVIAQALDSRIYATVVYHPPVNIKTLFEAYNGLEFFGEFFLSPAQYGNSSDVLLSRDARIYCNTTNTQNMMIIHGEDDGMITPESTYELYQSLDGPNRTDLAYILRPGLDHGPNEDDYGSRQFALAWFDAFFFNESIDIANIEQEAQFQTPVSFSPPSNALGNLILKWGKILMILGMFILWLEESRKQKLLHQNQNPVLQQDKESFQKTPEEFGKLVLMINIGAVIISALFFRLFSPNIVFGLFFLLPFLANIGSLLIWIRFSERKKYSFEKAKGSFRLNLAIIVPILFALILTDLLNIATLQRPPWVWKNSVLFYILAISNLFFWIYFTTKHTYEIFSPKPYGENNEKTALKDGRILIPMIIFGFLALIYHMIIPIPNLSLIPISLSLLIILGIGPIFVIIAILLNGIRKINQHSIMIQFLIIFTIAYLVNLRVYNMFIP